MFNELISPDGLAQVLAWGMPSLFVVLAAGFVILGVVLNYHWVKYAMNVPMSALFKTVYVAVGIGLLAVMAVSQAAYL